MALYKSAKTLLRLSTWLTPVLHTRSFPLPPLLRFNPVRKSVLNARMTCSLHRQRKRASIWDLDMPVALHRRACTNASVSNAEAIRQWYKLDSSDQCEELRLVHFTHSVVNSTARATAL